MSRIEQLISDIEAYIDNCKYQPFSNNKIIVDKDQLEDMLSELRLKTPDEIKKYQKILNNKDAIISDAKEQAENGYNLCTTQYVTLKASEGIVVEDNRKFIENYEELLQKLRNIDKELDEVRSRFVKEA